MSIECETAFLLWGRHAGVDKQTIMNLWGKLKEKTPQGEFSKKPWGELRKTSQKTDAMNVKLKELNGQLEKIKSPAADIPAY